VPKTRESRIEKCAPQILAGKGIDRSTCRITLKQDSGLPLWSFSPYRFARLTMVDRVARDRVIAAFEDFLDEKITAFELDGRLQEVDSADQTVKEVIHVAWFHYDDCTDHKVCLSKVGWDFFQRLLLILRSGAELSCSKTKRWSWDHVLAWAMLAVLAGAVMTKGWSGDLLPLGVLSAIVSLFVSFYRRRQKVGLTPREIACLPFDSPSQIRLLHRETPGFQKRRYRKEIEGRTIRSEEEETFNRVIWYASAIVLSPLILLFQGFPSTAECSLRITKS
jgi:hypothetical protein